MNKPFSRGARVAEQIRRELADLLMTEVKDPRIGMVSLTSVEVSPDYTHAKIFFSTLAVGEELESIERGLRQAAGFLRGQLGRRLHIHAIPELHFVHDSSLERGMQLSSLIDAAMAETKKTRD